MNNREKVVEFIGSVAFFALLYLMFMFGYAFIPYEPSMNNEGIYAEVGR